MKSEKKAVSQTELRWAQTRHYVSPQVKQVPEEMLRMQEKAATTPREIDFQEG